MAETGSILLAIDTLDKNAGTGLATSPVGCDSRAITKERSPEYKGTRDKVFLETVMDIKGEKND